jgi:hypothetical protein
MCLGNVGQLYVFGSIVDGFHVDASEVIAPGAESGNRNVSSGRLLNVHGIIASLLY